MENKEAHNTTTTTAATTTTPLGSMCEKLFNAINTNTTFRPLRRLTNRQQDTEPQSETQSNNFPATAATAAKHKTSSPPPKEKPKVAFTASSVAKNDVKVTDKKDTPSVAKKDPKGTGTAQYQIPVPVPPKGAVMLQPAPPTDIASTDTTNTKPKKSLNDKIEDYIQRTNRKLRSGSTLGRTPTKK